MNAPAAHIDLLPGVSPSVYGAQDFEAVRRLVHDVAGIDLPPSKAMLVYSRLIPLVRKAGCTTFGAYIERITNDAHEQSLTICALTTNHTFFYREQHHFEHFASQVRPGLIERLNHNGSARIWSAGCSSGEETWSLVMTMLGEDRAMGKRLAQRDLRFLASDLADHAIQAAQAASYALDALNPVPEPLRRAWAKEQDGRMVISRTAQSIARFRHLNLLHKWPMSNPFDVIFCRNVMIYFDLPTKERLVARFAEQLAPGGHLYIGHSERVSGPASEVLQLVGPTIYRKVSA